MLRIPVLVHRASALIATAVVVLALTMSSLLPLREAAAAPTSEQGESDIPHITVTGDGEVHAEPDQAIVTVGVSATGATSDEAMDAVNRTLAAVIGSIRALGIAEQDIQTSGLSLQPVYRSTQRSDDQPPEIIGYRASNNMTVTVRNLNQAGPVLDAALANGANSIGGIRFGISNTDALKRQALALATTDAESKARAIATAAGVSLTGVLSITESSVSAPTPPAPAALRAAPAAEAAAPTPVQAGELVVRARIQASYRI